MIFDFEYDQIFKEKITNSDQLITVIPIIYNHNGQEKRILLLRVNKQLRSVLFTTYPDENTDDSSFTGKILMQNLNGGFINGYRVKDGLLTSQFILKNQANTVTNKTITTEGYGGDNGGGSESFYNLDEVVVWNNYNSPMNSIDYMSLYTGYGTTESYTDNYEMNWNYGGGGSSGGSQGSHVVTTDEDEGVANYIEDNIDDSELDECPKAIIEKLKKLTQSDIASMFKKFDPNVSLFNIKIMPGTVNYSTDIAETQVFSPNNYNITLSSDYLNGVRSWAPSSPPTTLSIATTITHEIIHAYLLSLVDQYNVSSSSTIYDFSTLFDAYVTNKTKVGTQAQVDAQHEIIVEKYVNVIASTIQEFDTGISVTSGYPRQVSLDLAWAGLIGTDFFKKNYPDDATHNNYADRERIKIRRYVEEYNESRENQSPLGKPCK